MPVSTLVYRDTKFAGQNPAIDSLAALQQEPGVMLWVDLADPTDGEIKQVLETAFRFHPLAIEDCIADTPLPKLEEYEEYIYLVMHAVDYSATEHFTTTELDLFLGPNFVVTFHRKPMKSIEAGLERYRRSGGPPVRGPDRFAHAILDGMVEAYQPTLDRLRQALEQVEDGALKNIASAELFPRVIALRKDLSRLRQIVRPQREIAADLSQGRHRFIRPVIVPYLRDLSEELARIEAQAAAWAEQLILSFRIYLNKSGYEANEGIRILTGITALTLPALIVGTWYGMNYTKTMHELKAPHGYVVALIVMLLGTIGMLVFIRKRRLL